MEVACGVEVLVGCIAEDLGVFSVWSHIVQQFLTHSLTVCTSNKEVPNVVKQSPPRRKTRQK